MNNDIVPTSEPQQQNIVKHQVRAMDKVRSYFEMPEIRSRFAEILGDASNTYVNSVLVAVANSENLQACSLKSIAMSAINAATLGLSVDPILKQAHLVPYAKEAKLIPDYHGLIMLMENTGEYQTIHVAPIYNGEEVKVDRWSGRVDVTGEKVSEETIGWCGYFKKLNGFEKWLYMTNEECDAHGQKYNPGGFASKKSGWATDRDAMRRKTALRQLCNRWGHFSPVAKKIIFEAETMDAEFEDLPGDDDPRLPIDGRTDAEKKEDAAQGMAALFGGTVEEARATLTPAKVINAESSPIIDSSQDETDEERAYRLACEVTGSDGVKYGERTDAQLKWVAENPKSPKEKSEAAFTILEWRRAHK